VIRAIRTGARASARNTAAVAPDWFSSTLAASGTAAAIVESDQIARLRRTGKFGRVRRR